MYHPTGGETKAQICQWLPKATYEIAQETDTEVLLCLD